jgi:hypothetical protein
MTVWKREDTSPRTRVQRLKRTTVDAGCPACQDRLLGILRLFRKDSTGGAPVLVERDGDDGEPCPACGWMPQVTKIVKVVVTSREEVARCMEIVGSDCEMTIIAANGQGVNPGAETTRSHLDREPGDPITHTRATAVNAQLQLHGRTRIGCRSPRRPYPPSPRTT